MAFQFDGILSKLGLQGKAICPVMMTFGRGTRSGEDYLPLEPRLTLVSE